METQGRQGPRVLEVNLVHQELQVYEVKGENLVLPDLLERWDLLDNVDNQEPEVNQDFREKLDSQDQEENLEQEAYLVNQDQQVQWVQLVQGET